jgi:hypothetical protein
LLDTSVQGGPVPTGTIQFSANGVPLTGSETYQAVTDSSGRTALQADFTFAPQFSQTVTASYNGDVNYPQTNGGQSNITVNGNDFGIYAVPTSVTVLHPGGQTATVVWVGAQSSYVGTVNFAPASCSGLPQESFCNFSPSSVTGAGWSQLTITTTAPQAAVTGQTFRLIRRLGFSALGMPLAAILLIGIPRRYRRSLGYSVIGTILVLGLGCGGGSSGGGGGGGGNTDPGTPPGNYVITVTATSGSTTHTTTFTLVVQ